MEMVINMGVRLPPPFGRPTGLECECCKKEAVGVCAAIAVPYSSAFCATCLWFGAQPLLCVQTVYMTCNGDVADWYKDECSVYTLENGYESVRAYVARHPELVPDVPARMLW